VFPVYQYVHMIPISTFGCRFVRLELLSPYLDFALTLLLIVVTRMSTYINPMYYAVFLSLIINVLSFLSSAWLLESSRLDFIRTSNLYTLCSIGQIVTLTHHIYLVVLVSSLADQSLCIQPVFLSSNRLPNNRLASGHLTLTQDIIAPRHC
jgi:hypothetical protein